MNLADDISYAVHDVEDFVRAGLIPEAVFGSGSAEQSDFYKSFREARIAEGASDISASDVGAILGLVGLHRYNGTTLDLALMADFRTRYVDRFIRGIALEIANSGLVLVVPAVISLEIETLKHLTRYYVIESPVTQSQRFGQRRMIQFLFTTMQRQIRRGSKDALSIFPPLWKERMPDDAAFANRIIADYISSMTEMQVVDTFQKLSGLSQGSVVDPII
jgi:dGTPase